MDKTAIGLVAISLCLACATPAPCQPGAGGNNGPQVIYGADGEAPYTERSQAEGAEASRGGDTSQPQTGPTVNQMPQRVYGNDGEAPYGDTENGGPARHGYQGRE